MGCILKGGGGLYSRVTVGAVLLAAGTRGKRFALPNARIMIHQPLGGAEGQASDIEIQAKEILYIKENLNRILSSHTACWIDYC